MSWINNQFKTDLFACAGFQYQSGRLTRSHSFHLKKSPLHQWALSTVIKCSLTNEFSTLHVKVNKVLWQSKIFLKFYSKFLPIQTLLKNSSLPWHSSKRAILDALTPPADPEQKCFNGRWWSRWTQPPCQLGSELFHRFPPTIEYFPTHQHSRELFASYTHLFFPT